MHDTEKPVPSNFIHNVIDDDIRGGLSPASVHTRFPPEPNGYLHIGSAKAILINSGTAKKYGGLFNLRFDDTNPAKESDEYVRAIEQDLLWLGAVPTGGIFYGSDYFTKCYEFAVELIRAGKAYVCDLNAEQMREHRGTLTEPGRNSPYRDRSIEQNLELFGKMKNGELADGSCTLRAKIDMASPNLNMRDPALYRIVRITHHRQGDDWCIYPLYDYAHPIQDALEGITHSLCSIEFENHRPLYDWVVQNIGFEAQPHQYEFSRLNMTYTVMSKRYLRELVETNIVDGWDDPRMPTLCALRRRGYTPSSICTFIDKIGVSKAQNLVDIELLEHCIRDELNASAPRRMVVSDPLKVIITNMDSATVEHFTLQNNPNDEAAGTREVAFTNELYIEKSDFMVDAPNKFFRLKPGGEVRLAGAYVIKCDEYVCDDAGNVVLLKCSLDPDTRGKNPSDGRKIKGTIHWVSAAHAHTASVRVYDRLFTIAATSQIPEDKTYSDYLNPNSLTIYNNCKMEASLVDAQPGDRFQFVRNGYFCKDGDGAFNSTVELKSSK